MPTLDELAAQISAQQGLIADLAAQMSRKAKQTATEATAPVSVVPGAYWTAMRCESLTLTAGAGPPPTDWDPLFDDLATATNVVRFDVPTLSGNLNYAYIGGSTAQRRFSITFDCKAIRTQRVRLSGSRADDGTAGVVQIKVNEVVTEYTLDGSGSPNEHIIEMPLKAGRNRIVLSTNYFPFCTLLEARLIDFARGDTFVQPTDFSDFKR